MQRPIAYPSTFDEISAYSKAKAVSGLVARQRFAQYALLRTICLSRELSSRLVLKGGNALNTFHATTRSSRDLDFSTLSDVTVAELERGLNGAKRPIQQEMKVQFRLRETYQTTDENPPGHPSGPFRKIRVEVEFALQDEADLQLRFDQGQGLPKGHPNVIPLEISLGEVICECDEVDLGGANRLQVCSINDIVAEKLRGLLQQVTRGTNRDQDVLDIAAILRETPPLDPERVSRFLLEKAPVRNVEATRAAFRNPQVQALARENYDRLRQTANPFIEFDEAFAAVMGLVDSLAIPEG